jgi:hypothetical protein
MHQCLLNSKSFSWISSQQTLYEILYQVTFIGPSLGRKNKATSLNGIEYVFIGIAIEWWIATEQNVCDDADGPNITGPVVFAFQQFRRHVVGSPNGIIHGRFTLLMSS